MQAKLIVVGGQAKAAEIKLKLPTVLGRGRDATLTLPHPLVSRRHCEIFEADGRLRVRDLGSLNGTFVADDRITEADLPPGELLTIGSVTFRVEYDPQTGISPPSANGSQTAEEPVAEEGSSIVELEAISDGEGPDDQPASPDAELPPTTYQPMPSGSSSGKGLAIDDGSLQPAANDEADDTSDDDLGEFLRQMGG